MKQARIDYPLPEVPGTETAWNVLRRERPNAQRQLGHKGDHCLYRARITRVAGLRSTHFIIEPRLPSRASVILAKRYGAAMDHYRLYRHPQSNHRPKPGRPGRHPPEQPRTLMGNNKHIAATNSTCLYSPLLVIRGCWPTDGCQDVGGLRDPSRVRLHEPTVSGGLCRGT